MGQAEFEVSIEYPGEMFCTYMDINFKGEVDIGGVIQGEGVN